MSHHHQQEPQRVKPYKILAQTAGMVVCLFFVLFVIREEMPLIAKEEGNAVLGFLPFILLPVIGYIISWFKELPGTMIMIAGGVILMVYFLMQHNLNMALAYGLPFMIVGGLYLLHIRKRNLIHGKK